MDLHTLYTYTLTNFLTDLEIVFVDTEHEVKMSVHKVILSSASPYFENLFTKYREKKEGSIRLHVRNAHVSHDFIALLYGQRRNISKLPEWLHTLEVFLCFDYFQVKYNFSSLKKLKVPEEGFDLLLQVVDVIGYNNDSAALIYDNLPENYDVTCFSKQLRDYIFGYCSHEVVISFLNIKRKSNLLKVYHLDNTKTKLDYVIENVSFFRVSPDGTLLITIYSDGYEICIYNTTYFPFEMIKTFDLGNVISNGIRAACISHDNKTITLLCHELENYIIIVDIQTESYRAVKTKIKPTSLRCFPNGIVMIFEGMKLHIFDPKTEQVINYLSLDKSIHICAVDNGDKFVICDTGEMRLYDTFNSTCLLTLPLDPPLTSPLQYILNSNNLIICCTDHKVIIADLMKKCIVNVITLPGNDIVVIKIVADKLIAVTKDMNCMLVDINTGNVIEKSKHDGKCSIKKPVYYAKCYDAKVARQFSCLPTCN